MVHLYKPPCCDVVPVWYLIITTACVRCVFDRLARKDWLARVTCIQMCMYIYVYKVRTYITVHTCTTLCICKYENADTYTRVSLPLSLDTIYVCIQSIC